MKRIFNDNTISYKSLGLYFAIESLLENGEEWLENKNFTHK